MLQAGHSLQNGRYLLTRFLRAGGAGVVWAAQDRRPRKGDATDVAIKVLDAAAGGADAAAREAEVAARVRHPNVVRVRDTFVEDGLACMVMDLARCSLADLVAREGPLPPPVALGCALQACAALAEAHRAGVVHRDVKPHNLLVFGDGSVRLGDFGAARALMDGHTRTRTGALLGSIPFMAPEQRRDPRAVRPSTDVYGLAVTLAWLLLGEAPDDPWTEEAAGQLRAAGTPDGLVRGIATGGARRAEERPQDAAAYLAILEACGVVAGPLAQNDVDETSVDRHGSREMPASVRGVEQLGAGGSRPPQRPRVRDARPYTGQVALVVSALSIATLGAMVGHACSNLGSEHLESKPNLASMFTSCHDAPDDWLADVRLGPKETLDAAVADVDDDGLQDVLFANNYSETTTVWWGEHGILPTHSTEIPTGRHVVAPAAADFDGDGHTDLVVGLHNDAGLLVLRGQGNRRFLPSGRIFQDPSPVRVTTGDVDHDGHDDISFTGKADAAVYVRHGVAAPEPGWEPQKLAWPPRGGAYAQPMALRGAITVVAWSGSTLSRMPLNRQGSAGTSSVTDLGLPVVGVLQDAIDTSAVIARVDAKGRHALLRVTDDSPPCLVGTRSPERRVHAVADLDQDGIADLIESLTCQMCDSNHIFMRGIR